MLTERVRSRKRARFYCSTSLLALVLAGTTAPVSAQENASSETVVVTSSRIVRNGFSAPTPTTVVGAQDIANQAEPNVFNTINELPALAGSTSTATGNGGVSGATNGLATFNARGLGTNRTLTLLDGERVISPLLNGVVDVNQLPQGLIQRVDVVTGGASASWGSDAVAGVVNLVLDKKFDGLKANISGSTSTYGDDTTGQIQLTAGTGFADDKGHVEFSGEFMTNSGVPTGIGSRKWYRGTKILQRSIAGTPPGTPEYTVANNVVDFQVAPGGIITAGPLKGTTFGPGGQPLPYVYGNPQITPFMVGGDQSSEMGSTHSGLDAALTRGSIYGRVSYDLAPNLTIYASGLYAVTHTFVTSIANQYKTANLTIQCGNAAGGPNAYLPASINAACVANNITNFQYGTFNKDFQSVNGGGLDTVTQRTLHRFSLGANGVVSVLGTDWIWNSYAAHGWNDSSDRLPNTSLTPRYNAAIDAVAQNGTIVCRSAVARAAGCIPLDIIGTGVASPEALKYVLGTTYLNTENRQELASVSASGEPFSDWAGPVSVAFGGEYREEAFEQQSDCASVGNCGDPVLSSAGSNWFAGNFHPSRGSFHVSEAFVETVVPLLKDAKWGDADLNVAGRATGYSSAGYVSTWKVGLTYATNFIDGLKFRALQSRDVRAPNLGELYQAPQVFVQTVIDDFPPRAGQTFTIQRITIGNTALLPEKSQTTQIGMVYQPSWFPGFNSSVDYYRIGLKQAIGSLTNQQEMDLCFQGDQSLCNLIGRNTAGVPITVTGQSINLASTFTDGFDIEASYETPLSDWFDGAGGNFSIRGLANHVSKFLNNSGLPNSPVTETAGQNTGPTPLWHLLGVETYNNGKYNLTLTERYISAGVINKAWVQCTTGCPLPTINNPTINNNQIDGAFYLDVGGSYDITDYLQAYFKVDNITDLDPPVAPTSSMFGNSTNPSLYDVIGRTYRIGFRFND